MAAEPLRKPQWEEGDCSIGRGYEITSSGRVVADPAELFKSRAVREIFEIAERIVEFSSEEPAADEK